MGLEKLLIWSCTRWLVKTNAPSFLTGRDFQQNQTQRGAALYCGRVREKWNNNNIKICYNHRIITKVLSSILFWMIFLGISDTGHLHFAVSLIFLQHLLARMFVTLCIIQILPLHLHWNSWNFIEEKTLPPLHWYNSGFQLPWERRSWAHSLTHFRTRLFIFCWQWHTQWIFTYY